MTVSKWHTVTDFSPRGLIASMESLEGGCDSDVQEPADLRTTDTLHNHPQDRAIGVSAMVSLVSAPCALT